MAAKPAPTVSNQLRAAQLVDATLSPEARLKLVMEIKDTMDVVHSPEYGAFLLHLFPAFKHTLERMTVPQHADNVLHKTRVCVLEILKRLPCNEVLRTRVQDLLVLAMNVLRVDNEENAVTAIHIIFELHKGFRGSLERAVQPFLDFVSQLYESFTQSCQRSFPPPGPDGTLTPAHLPPGALRMSTSSFKVITECPLIVTFLFQVYPGHMSRNIPRLLPLMVRAIESVVPRDRIAVTPKHYYQEFIASQVKTVSFLAYYLLKDPAYVDVMNVHANTIPRSVVQLLQACPPDAASIRRELLIATRHIVGTASREGFYSQINLLLDESVLVGTGRGAHEIVRPLAYSILAELLHFVRFRLTFDQFSRVISLFSTNLHDRTLSYNTQTTSVRLLLNLIECILKYENADRSRRRQLLVWIITTIVSKYEAIAGQVPELLKDAEKYYESARGLKPGELLSKEQLTDPIKDITDCKHLFKTLTLGLKTLVWSVQVISVQGQPAQATPGAAGAGLPGAPGVAGLPSVSGGAVNIANPTAMVLGGAGAAAGVPSSGAGGAHVHNAAGAGSGAAGAAGAHGTSGIRVGLHEEECELLASLLPSMKECLKLYHAAVVHAQEAHAANSKSPLTGLDHLRPDVSVATAVHEEKEILECFAQIFAGLDVRCFQDIFGLRMPDLFEHVVENPTALAIPQHFLSSHSCSKYFADILLSFLASRIGDLGVALSDDPEVETKLLPKSPVPDKRALGLLRLFRILFASVTLFPKNEAVLKPHLANIVRDCLSCALRCEDPGHYLQLLRALFKALSTGKQETQYDLLYRDFMPLVEPVVDGLLELYKGPQGRNHKDLIIELCLTPPARPSTMFPFLHKQLKPMVWALSSSTRENVLFGLRTILFWVETLQPEFLDNLLNDVEPDLTKALQKLARPSRVSSSTLQVQGLHAIKILGKLGKRSRRASQDLPVLEPRENPDAALRLQLSWTKGTRFNFDADTIVRVSSSIVLGERPGVSKSTSSGEVRHAWGVLRSCICPFLGVTRGVLDNLFVDGGGSTVHADTVQWYSALRSPSDVKLVGAAVEPEKDGVRRTRALYRSEAATVRRILVALIAAGGMDIFKERVGKSISSSATDANIVSEENAKTRVSADPKHFALGLARFYALLQCKGAGGITRKTELLSVRTGVSDYTAPASTLDPDLFTEALVEVASSENRQHAQAGLQCLKEYVDAILDFGGSPASVAGTAAVRGDASSSKSKDVQATAGVNPEPNDVTVNGSAKPKVDAEMRDVGTKGTSIASGTPGGESAEKTVSPKKAAAPEQLETAAKTQETSKTSPAGKDVGKEVPVARGQSLSRCALEALATLVDRLSHCCYKQGCTAKWAGAMGLIAIIERAPVQLFQVRMSPAYEAHVIRAFMFVVRDLSDDVRIMTTTAARRGLRLLLEKCRPLGSNVPQDVSRRALRDVVTFLIMDLISDSPGARSAAKEGIRIVAGSMNLQVAAVVWRAKEQIVRSVKIRSLSLMPFQAQTGFVDAMTFCLELEKPIFQEELFKPPLLDFFLLKVLELAEDNMIEKLSEFDECGRQKWGDSDLGNTKLVVFLPHLRRYCIDFLRALVTKCSHVLRKPEHTELFKKIVACLFKSLQSRDEKIAVAAKAGLSQAISKLPNPKDVQVYLRPILARISDYRQLSIPYLKDLSSVLELTFHWFHVQFGDKLLEHLEHWTDPEKLAAVKVWTPLTESLVGAAILDLFHLLPPQAGMFLSRVVHIVVRLESVLALAGPGVAHKGLQGPDAASTSPYRAPLLKYCNKHADLACLFFFRELSSPRVRQLFFVLLRADDGGPLRQEVASKPDRILEYTFVAQAAQSDGMQAYNGVRIVDALAERDAMFLSENKKIMSAMTLYWSSSDRWLHLSREETNLFERLKETRVLAKCFIRHCRAHPGDVEVLFQLLQVFSLRTIVDFSFVKDFLSDEVPGTFSNENKKSVFAYFLSFFGQNDVSQERKVHALQFLIVPVLTRHLETRASRSTSKNEKEGNESGRNATPPSAGNRPVAQISVSGPSRTQPGVPAQGPSVSVAQADMGTSRVAVPQVTAGPNADAVLDEGMLRRIVDDLLNPRGGNLAQYDEPLSAELLQVATLLIQYMPNEIGCHRKALIKFGWDHLKREDSIAKQWAFVNVSRFFEAYVAPDKIILQVYVALLRPCQTDGRHLVRQALDILIPALPKRLSAAPGDQKLAMWIRYTKKILLEEGSSTPHLVHICQLIARHPDLFYAARGQFVPIMVNALSRIALANSATPENRRFALDLAALVISWEKKRNELAAEGPRAAVGTKRPRDSGTEAERASGSQTSALVVGSESGGRNDQAGGEPPQKLLRGIGSAVVRVPEGAPIPASNVSSGNGAPILPAAEGEDFRLAPVMADSVVNFLAQIALQLERREAYVITRRAIELMDMALELWPNATVQLGFLEKLDSLAVDRLGGDGTAAGSSKGLQSGGAGTDARQARGNSKVSKADKAAMQLQERKRTRALLVALELSLVIVDRQGKQFVAQNGGAIRAMVAPAMMDRNVAVAQPFAKLLGKILAFFPASVIVVKKGNGAPVGSSAPGSASGTAKALAPGNVPGTKGGANKASAAAAGRSAVAAVLPPASGSVVAGGTQPSRVAGQGPNKAGLTPSTGQKSSNLVPGASDNLTVKIGRAGSAGSVGLQSGGHLTGLAGPEGIEARAKSAVNAVYARVSSCLEKCLTSDPPNVPNVHSIHCGLIVLAVLVKMSPDEFAKYQELVIKSLNRMARESLSMPPQSSASNHQQSGAAGGHAKPSGKGGPSGSSGASVRGSSSGQDSSAHGHGGWAGASGRGNDGSPDGQALILGLSLTGMHITNLETSQKRTFFQVLYLLIDRGVQVKVLLEIVRITGLWIRWRPTKKDRGVREVRFSREPLTPKDKVSLLNKMTVFERITGQGSETLMAAYLNIILTVFGGGEDPGERRPDLLLKLERAFMIGLKTDMEATRGRFFRLFDRAIDRSPLERLRYAIAQQNWEPLADSYWIRQALELLLAVIDIEEPLLGDKSTAVFPQLVSSSSGNRMTDNDESTGAVVGEEGTVLGSSTLLDFVNSVSSIRSADFVNSVWALMHVDIEVAQSAWLGLFPQVWSLIPVTERPGMETALETLFTKEYHASQMFWPRSVLPALLEGASRCKPLPIIRPEIVMHVGIRWNAWFVALPYLERRTDIVRRDLVALSKDSDEGECLRLEAELESLLDASCEIYRRLKEKDMFAAVWKRRCDSPGTAVALCLEQQGQFAAAQEEYGVLNIGASESIEAGTFKPSSTGVRGFRQEAMESATGSAGFPAGRAEICLWESRWVECARELCQWDVLTEFSRTCMRTDLLQDCLWRSSDWSETKELMERYPVEDGPQLKIYESYVRLHEKKLDPADVSINASMLRAIERFCSLPSEIGCDATTASLVQFQQIVELDESRSILHELHTLSGLGGTNVNVEQRIDVLKGVLTSWRERLPGLDESLVFWSDIVTWRNHVHRIVVNVLEALKSSASSTVEVAQRQAAPGVGSAAGPGKQGANSNSSRIEPAAAQAAVAITNALNNQQALIMGVNETAWTVHRFARTCRRQGLPGVALNALHQLYPFGTMEVSEFFVKTRETAQSFMSKPPGVDNSYLHGLNELNRCNMDHFSAHQKAELFTLKGEFCKALGQNEATVEAYRTALSTASDVSGAWLAWGLHCDDVQKEGSQKMTDVEGGPEVSQDSDLLWREATVNCYFHAMNFGSEKARLYVPRALRLLTLDLAARLDGRRSKPAPTGVGESTDMEVDATAQGVPGPNGKSPSGGGGPVLDLGPCGVEKVFLSFVDILPAWIWIPWIPQIVPMLARGEARVAHAVLLRVVTHFPQAVFFPLKILMEERKAVDQPTRNLTIEALRTSRPNVQPLHTAHANAQLAGLLKHVSASRNILQQANLRYQGKQMEYKKLAELVSAKANTDEHAGLLIQATKLKSEIIAAQRSVERAMKAYQVAEFQRKSATQSAELQKKSMLAQVEASARQASASGSSGAAAGTAGSSGALATRVAPRTVPAATASAASAFAAAAAAASVNGASTVSGVKGAAAAGHVATTPSRGTAAARVSDPTRATTGPAAVSSSPAATTAAVPAVPVDSVMAGALAHATANAQAQAQAKAGLALGFNASGPGAVPVAAGLGALGVGSGVPGAAASLTPGAAAAPIAHAKAMAAAAAATAATAVGSAGKVVGVVAGISNSGPAGAQGPTVPLAAGMPGSVAAGSSAAAVSGAAGPHAVSAKTPALPVAGVVAGATPAFNPAGVPVTGVVPVSSPATALAAAQRPAGAIPVANALNLARGTSVGAATGTPSSVPMNAASVAAAAVAAASASNPTVPAVAPRGMASLGVAGAVGNAGAGAGAGAGASKAAPGVSVVTPERAAGQAAAGAQAQAGHAAKTGVAPAVNSGAGSTSKATGQGNGQQASGSTGKPDASARKPADPGTYSPKTAYEYADGLMARIVRSHQSLYFEMTQVAEDLQKLKPHQEEQVVILVNALLHRCYGLQKQPGKEVAASLRGALEEVSRTCFGTKAPGDPATNVRLQTNIADLKASFEAELAPQTSKDFPKTIEPFIVRLRKWKSIFQRRVDWMSPTQRLEHMARYLVDVRDSEMEVFGQYLSGETKEVNASTHVKINRFLADMRVIRRASGPARGLTILGDNGKRYTFIVETSVKSAAQPTEERAAQLCRLLNASFFGRHSEASRRRLKVNVPKLIPTNPYTRLVSDDVSYASLFEGLERYLAASGKQVDDPIMAFRDVTAQSLSKRQPQIAAAKDESARKHQLIAARMDAYHAVCSKHVPDTCLANWVASSVPNAGMHYGFRRRLGTSLGTASLVSYALGIGARRAQDMLFSWTTGGLCNAHMRPLVSARGLLECNEAVPFRLTRNMQALLGRDGVHGALFGALSVALRALRSDDALLRVLLEAVMRDELVAWAAAAAAAPDAAHALVEARLEPCVSGILDRLTAASVLGPKQDRAGTDAISEARRSAKLDDVSSAVYELMDRAADPRRLAQMEASFQAWF